MQVFYVLNFSQVQLAIEFLLLAKALVFFFTLVYVHTAFIKADQQVVQALKHT